MAKKLTETRASSLFESLRLKVTYHPLDAFKLNPKNARRHPTRQVRQLAKCLEEFGFVRPILVNNELSVIAGHGRIQAAVLAGFKEVPAISIAHLTPHQQKKLAIADNKLSDNSSFDDELLAEELRQILAIEPDFDCDALGFEAGEIDFRLVEPESADASEADSADVFIVGSGPTVTRLGMTWQLGPHRLRCDDARETSAYDELMAGEKAAAVASDPPFNVAVSGHISGRGKVKHREFAMASGEMDPATFVAFLKTTLGHAVDHAKPGALAYAFMDWRHSWELLLVGRELKLDLLNIAAWVKTSPGQGGFYRSQHEFCFVFRKPGARHRNNVQLGRHGRNRSNVWQYPGANNPASTGEEGRLLELHATAKPVRLIADIVLDCTARSEIILDPFAGAGSALIAAQRVGRRFFGLELDPAYVDTAVRRWQAFTGDFAVDTATGQKFNQFTAR